MIGMILIVLATARSGTVNGTGLVCRSGVWTIADPRRPRPRETPSGEEEPPVPPSGPVSWDSVPVSDLERDGWSGTESENAGEVEEEVDEDPA